MINLSFDSVSQTAHTALGFFIVTTPYLIWIKHPVFQHPIIIGNALGVTWAAFKEFIFDKNFEDSQTRGNDLEDFLFYLLGIGIGNFILWI